MGNEAYGRHMTVGDVAGQGGHQVTVIIKSNLGETQLAQLVLEMARKNHLARCRWRHVGELIALGVEFYILQEAVSNVHYLLRFDSVTVVFSEGLPSPAE